MKNIYLRRVEDATADLLRTVSALDDVSMAQPSLLPGWDRAMVVTHLAANAEGLSRVVEAAQRGEVGEVYPGGQAARDAEIEAGRGRPARELELRLRSSSDAAAAALAAAPDQVWDAPCLQLSGETKIGPGRVIGKSLSITST
jgi:maleylpyruvate isomerase